MRFFRDGLGSFVFSIFGRNPLVLFLYGVFSKWYLVMLISAITVVFWVYSGLKSAGILDTIESTITEGILQSKAVAQHCVPKIGNIAQAWECVKSPPVYRKIEQRDLDNLSRQAESSQKSDALLEDLINPYQDGYDEDEKSQENQPAK